MADKKTSGEKLLYCSFCGKSQHEVRKLIAGRVDVWGVATLPAITAVSSVPTGSTERSLPAMARMMRNTEAAMPWLVLPLPAKMSRPICNTRRAGSAESGSKKFAHVGDRAGRTFTRYGN